MKILLLLSFILCTVVSGTDHQKPYRIIGIYSICQNSPNKTLDNLKAMIFHKSLLLAMSLNNDDSQILSTKSSPVKRKLSDWIYYEFYDVCNNLQQLPSITIQMMLNASYYPQNRTSQSSQHSDILLLISYLNKDQAFLFDGLMEYDRTYSLLILNPIKNRNRRFYNLKFIEAKSFIENSKEEFMKEVHYFGWENIELIALISHSGCQYLDYYNQIVEEFHRMKEICFSANYVNMTSNVMNMSEILVNLLNPHTNVIVLFGDRIAQLQFIREARHLLRHGSLNSSLIWVLHDMPEFPYQFDLEFVINNGLRYNRLDYQQVFKLFPDVQTLIGDSYQSMSEEVKKTMRYRLEEAIQIIVRTYRLLESTVRPSQLRKIIHRLLPTMYTSLTNVKIENLQFYRISFETEYEKEEHQVNEFIRNKFAGASCKPEICPPGWVKAFDRVLPPKTVFKHHYGWTCTKCQPGLYKPSYGDGPCSMCPGILRANQNQTSCYDPHRKHELNISIAKVKVMVAFSYCGTALTICFAVLVFKYRNTPLGRIVDSRISLIQIFTISLYFTLIPLMFLLKHTPSNCIVKLSTIFPLYILNISVVVVKSLKVLKAFTSQVLIKRRETIMTSLKQISTICTLTLISFILLGFTILYRTPDIKTKLFRYELEREVYCDYSVHVRFQLALAILIHLSCVVPAYRGRNLPNICKEAMSILYLSFVSVLTLVVILTVEYFHQYQSSRDLTVWVGLYTNTVILLLFLYGEKIFIMIFRPEKNTKRYFQEQTLKMMNEAAKRKLARKKLNKTLNVCQATILLSTAVSASKQKNLK